MTAKKVGVRREVNLNADWAQAEASNIYCMPRRFPTEDRSYAVITTNDTNSAVYACAADPVSFATLCAKLKGEGIFGDEKIEAYLVPKTEANFDL